MPAVPDALLEAGGIDGTGRRWRRNKDNFGISFGGMFAEILLCRAMTSRFQTKHQIFPSAVYLCLSHSPKLGQPVLS